MGLAVVRFSDGDRSRWGVKREAEVFPLELELDDHRALMRRYYDDRDTVVNAIGDQPVSADDLHYLAPLAPDVQIF